MLHQIKGIATKGLTKDLINKLSILNAVNAETQILH